MKSTHAIRLLTAGVLAAAIPAHAQWYVGISGGESKAEVRGDRQDDQLLDLGFDDASTTIDDKDGAYRVHGGYRFNRNIAFEVGFTDLGRFSQRTTVRPTGALDTRVEVQGFDASILGLLPIGERFTVFGRVGAFAARTRTEFSGSGSVVLFDGAQSSSKRTTSAVYGVGAMYDFTRNFSVRAEYVRYHRIGDESTGEYEPTTLTAGIQYRF